MSTGPISATTVNNTYDNDQHSTDTDAWNQKLYQLINSTVHNDVHKALSKIDTMLYKWDGYINQPTPNFINESGTHVGGKHNNHHALIQSHSTKVMDEDQKKKLQHQLEKIQAELEAEQLKDGEHHQLTHNDKVQTLKARISKLEKKLKQQTNRVMDAYNPTRETLQQVHNPLADLNQKLKENIG